MYTVTYTNYKNEETEVKVYGATSEKQAWGMADAAKAKYLNNVEQVELGQVTATREGE